MSRDAAKAEALEALRVVVASHRAEPIAPRSRHERRSGIASGWAALDAVLPHAGLDAGEIASVEAAAGAGGLALASSWARSAASAGEPAIAIDTLGSTLPHAWVEPPDARAPIWVVVPPAPRDAWIALDLALRSGAFGLVVALDLPAPPPHGASARVRQLAHTHRTRVVSVGPARAKVAGASLVADVRVSLSTRGVEWIESPVGAAPAVRWIAARCTVAEGIVTCEVRREDALTDRLRPAPRAADRRAPHGRPSRARLGKR